MKLIRTIQHTEISRLFIPALAVLFVFSLSFHNHAISGSTSISVDSHTHSSHSVEDCSACLLQGNLQVPKTESSFNYNKFGHVVGIIAIDFVVPNSYLNINTPSRAPPTA